MRKGWRRFKDKGGMGKSHSQVCCCRLKADDGNGSGTITSLKCNMWMLKIKEKRGWMIGTVRATEDNG